MNNFRIKIRRNFDFSSVHHPITMHHAYVGYEYMEDIVKVTEYKKKLLSEGYNTWDIEDCFDFVNRYKGETPKNHRDSIYFAPIQQGELDCLNLPKRLKINKINSFQNYVIYSYYFTFPHSLKLPENSKVTEENLALNFVSWWDQLDDKTFFNPSFWQSLNWVEKEREWQREG